MQIVRVYSGADGESHFEDLTTEQFAEIVNRVGPRRHHPELPSLPQLFRLPHRASPAVRDELGRHRRV